MNYPVDRSDGYGIEDYYKPLLLDDETLKTKVDSGCTTSHLHSTHLPTWRWWETPKK